MKKLRKRHSGEGYIDVCVLVVCAMLVLALAVRILPVFVAKQQLDTYAVELVREAEISGRVGTETSRRAAALTDSTGLDPNIRWSKTGRIQLNEEVTVTLTLDMDVRLSDMNRAKIQFVTGSVANQYNALQLTILNRSEGQVDTLRLRFSDLLGTKATSNPNFRNGVDPHIWDDYGKVDWYVYHPTRQDYEKLSNAVSDYLEVLPISSAAVSC